MNLLGQKVTHIAFGEGTVIQCFKLKSNNTFNFLVSFKDKEREFSYPNAFEKFLTANDSDIQNEISIQLKEMHSTNTLIKLIQEVDYIEKQKHYTTESHAFNFEGGKELTAIGASWFVSYSYYRYIDNNHLNWKKSGTAKSRIVDYYNTEKYHKYWIKEVLNMNEKRLSKNEIELNGSQIKKMADELLNILP